MVNVPKVTRNLQRNPSWEVDNATIVTANTAGITFTWDRSSTQADVGTWSSRLNITANSGGAGGYVYNCPDYFVFVLGVEAGKRHVARCRFRPPTTAWGTAINIDWFDAAGGFISTVATGQLFGLTANAFNTITLDAVAPVGAVKARVFHTIHLSTAGLTGTAYMDAYGLLTGPSADTYGDGDQPGWAWEGTAHLSSSIKIESLAGPLSGRRDSHLLTISEAGDDHPIRLPVNGVDCSWRVNRRGDLSAEIETDLLRSAGLLACRGYWVRFRVPDMGSQGDWAGVIQRVRHDGGSGTTELAAQTKEAQLDARRTARQYNVDSGDAGGIAAKIIAENAAEASSYIKGDRIGITDLVALQIRAEMVADAVEQCAKAAGAEWRVTHDDYFEFTDRIGWDRSGEVLLLEGRDFSTRGWETIEDIGPVVTDLLAMSGVDEYRRKTAVVVLNEALGDLIGDRQGSRVFPYYVKQSQLRPAARSILASMARLGRGATIQVKNQRRVWTTFAEGDSIRIKIPTRNASGTMRVMARVWSSTGNRLTVSGEWE